MQRLRSGSNATRDLESFAQASHAPQPIEPARRGPMTPTRPAVTREAMILIGVAVAVVISIGLYRTLRPITPMTQAPTAEIESREPAPAIAPPVAPVVDAAPDAPGVTAWWSPGGEQLTLPAGTPLGVWVARCPTFEDLVSISVVVPAEGGTNTTITPWITRVDAAIPDETYNTLQSAPGVCIPPTPTPMPAPVYSPPAPPAFAPAPVIALPPPAPTAVPAPTAMSGMVPATDGMTPETLTGCDSPDAPIVCDDGWGEMGGSGGSWDD